MSIESAEAVTTPTPEAAHAGRLAGKTVVITGAAGNLGSEISRYVAREGAFLVMTGRTEARINAAMEALIAETGVPSSRVMTVVLDGGDPGSVRAAMLHVKSVFGRVDVLINNAGSAGPKQTLDSIPLTTEEMEACGESETVADAMRNIFGVTWNLTRAIAPLMPRGGSILNISTIFSHTPYFARAPYVVPKAALNALSQQLAKELGARGIRVNTVFPGPIESERIRTVFAAMDKLQGLDDGSTADYFLGKMYLKRSIDGGRVGKALPTPQDIANTCVFLASDESAALSGAELDVTHAMSVVKESRSTFTLRPTMRDLDGTGLSVLVLAGERWEDALDIVRLQLACGARVLLGLTRQADVAQAEARMRAQGFGDNLSIARFNHAEPEKMEELLNEYSAEKGSIASAIILPVKPPHYFSGILSDADDDEVEEFIEVELVGVMAVARTLDRYWKKRTDLLQPPRVVFISNPSDGAEDNYHRLLSAGIGQLIQIWRDEARVTAPEGHLAKKLWGNQIVRYTNREEENAWFAAGHATRLVLNEQR
ncbi:MAG: SDR family oxidoreductase, partial [Pseudomonadota bacterium]